MKDVKGFEGLYAVDQNGNVWSYRKNGLLKLWTNTHGYYTVVLCKDKERKTYTVHRLVAQAYLENYSDNLQVDHINGDRLNNYISNLRMVTSQQNQWNKTKAKGFCWNKNAKKWQAQIKINNKIKYLGYFNTEAEARESYLKAKEIYHII